MFKRYSIDAFITGILFAPDSATAGLSGDGAPSGDASAKGGEGDKSGDKAGDKTGDKAGDKTGNKSGDGKTDDKASDDKTGDKSGDDKTTDKEPSIEDLQGLPTVTDKELMGTPDDADVKAKAEADAKAKTEADAKAKAEADTKAQKEAEDAKAAKEKDAANSKSKADDDKSGKGDDKSGDKPPKGFVPTQALHEVRGENRYLKEQVAIMQAKLEKLPTKVEDTKPKELKKPEAGFDILSDSDFEKLTDDDPSSALKYTVKLAKHNEALAEYTAAVKQQETDKANAESTKLALAEMFTATNEAMEKHVPGLFDKESTAQADLVKFADSVGFTKDLFYLTDPSTQIILPGETDPLYLGEQAADVVKILTTVRKTIEDAAVEPPDLEKIKADLTKEIEAELIKKFKNSSDKSFTSLKEIPDSDNAPEFSDKVLTDAQFEKLSTKEKEAYLSGA